MTLAGRSLTSGQATGEALLLEAPLSFYGGVAPDSGTIIDHSHPQRGACMAGRVLVLPGGRGSSSSSSVLAEAIRLGTGPCAILIERADAIMVIGAIVAQRLYGVDLPIMVAPIGSVRDGEMLSIDCRDDGSATAERPA